jgi:hypothetical protein
MITVDLNDYPEAGSCGEIARQLIKTGSFCRGTTKVFNEDFKLAYWAGTRVKESTDSEWMKTVKYDGSFQLRTPRQMASGVGVTVSDAPHMPESDLCRIWT